MYVKKEHVDRKSFISFLYINIKTIVKKYSEILDFREEKYISKANKQMMKQVFSPSLIKGSFFIYKDK